MSLKYFIAVAEFASFTKASERLYVSQPTLSRQVQDLEQLLGVELFIRHRTSLSLTQPGVRLLAEAKDIVKRCDALRETVRLDDEAVSGVLTIGYQEFLDTRVMYRMMRALVRRHPDIDFVLSRGTPPDLRQALLIGGNDVVFTLHACVQSIPQVRIVKIATNRLQVALPDSHPLAERASLRLEELAGERFIMLEHKVSPLTVEYVTGLFTKTGMTPEYSHYVDNAETALFMVGVGKGITFVHSRNDVLAHTDSVAVVDLDGMDDELDHVLAYRGDRLNPLLPLFLAELDADGPVE